MLEMTYKPVSKIVTGIFFFSFLAALPGCYSETESTDLKNYQSMHGDRVLDPQIQILLNDFKGLSSDTLQSNAIPLKLAVTGLVMRRNAQTGAEISKQTFNQALEEYGFIFPDKIENLNPNAPMPKFEYPIGMIRGDLVMNLGVKVQAELANITCAACHSSRTYDSSGNPTRNAWLGAPNSSINLEGYTNEIYEGFKYIRNKKEETLSNMRRIFPNISHTEFDSIEHLVFMQTSQKITLFEQGSDKVLPFFNGPAGFANAIGSFKRLFGIYAPGFFSKTERGMVNIPDISYRPFKRTLTVDGIYTPLGEKPLTPINESEATFERTKKIGAVGAVFLTPVMGVLPKVAETVIPEMEESFAKFIFEYKAPQFPGAIDSTKALAGEKTYRDNCMKCHGEYSPGLDHPHMVSFPNVLVDVEKIGTDSTRLDVITTELVNKMKQTWYPKRLQMSLNHGYIAPVLSNIWSTAPYLHNGSVPTLWALMNPDERPEKFYVGGHSLDFEKVGIAYHEAVKPTSKPVLVDTTLLGLSNKGHERPFNRLTQEEKKNLIEYLKVL